MTNVKIPTSFLSGQKSVLTNAIALLLGAPLISMAIAMPTYADEKIKSDKTTTQSDSANPTKTPKKTVEDDSVFELGELVVNSGRSRSGKLTSRDILSSVDVMNADKIQNQNVLTSFDLFHRMPGVQITQFNQGTTTGKLSFRGFNGEGNINAVKLLIDGIPSNTNDGNMPFIDAIFPLDLESIEVVRGTNDPRYGLHAIAGNAAMNTTQGGNYLKARASYGSFNTYDIQSGAGYEQNGFSQNYSINYRSTDGYRDHAKSEKNSFSGKWFYSPENKKYKVGLIARWSEADAEEPGYLTYAQSRANPTQSMSHNQTDGGKRQVGQLSGHFDVNLTDELFWSTKSYANTYDDNRFVRFSATTVSRGAVVDVSQQNRVTEEIQYGATTSLTYHPRIDWLKDFSVESGFDVQYQENKSARFNTVNRVTTAQIRNQEFGFYDYGGYVQMMVKPFDWLKITPGFRVDQIGGSYANNLNGQSYPINNYGSIWQPKIGVVLTPLEGYSLYGNWGKTYQVAVGTGTYKTTPTATDLAPSINEGWEIGMKVKPVSWAEGRVAYWEQSATNEWQRQLNNPNNDSINVGATQRRGVDIQVKVTPISQVSLWGTYSLQEAIIKKPAPATPQFAGNKVDHTPTYVFSTGIDYQPTPELKASLWASGQGNYYLDSANSGSQFGEYALLNLDLSYKVHKNVELQFQAKNLTNTYWEYVWTDGAQSLHAPGDGIAFYGAVNVNYDLMK